MNDPKTTEELLDEVRLLFHRAAEVAEHLHAEEPIGVSPRAVLEYLMRHPPTTVPGIARSRHVSRQHVQVLVNELLEQGLVKLEDNPAHARSKLVAPTARGERLFQRMHGREREVLRKASARIGAARMQQAIRTLRDVRTALETTETRTP